MLWKNHYFRKNLKEWDYNLSPNASIVYDAITNNELVSLDTIVRNVRANKDNELVKNEKEVKTLVEFLIKQKYVGEAISERVFRFVKGL